jgi:hypothetical protein
MDLEYDNAERNQYCKEKTEIGTIQKKTSKKAQIRMGIRCQEWPEKDYTYKMDRTSPRWS